MKKIHTGCPGMKNSMSKSECDELIETFDRSKFNIFSVIIELSQAYEAKKRESESNFFRGSKLR